MCVCVWFIVRWRYHTWNTLSPRATYVGAHAHQRRFTPIFCFFLLISQDFAIVYYTLSEHCTPFHRRYYLHSKRKLRVWQYAFIDNANRNSNARAQVKLCEQCHDDKTLRTRIAQTRTSLIRFVLHPSKRWIRHESNSFKDLKLNLCLGLPVYGCFINRNDDASQNLVPIESAVVASTGSASVESFLPKFRPKRDGLRILRIHTAQITPDRGRPPS